MCPEDALLSAAAHEEICLLRRRIEYLQAQAEYSYRTNFNWKALVDEAYSDVSCALYDKKRRK